MRVDIVWVSIRRFRVIHLPFLRQNGLYGSVELVFIHNYTSVQFLVFQTHVYFILFFQSDGCRRCRESSLVIARSALCAGLSSTPPRMESNAVWGRGDTTSSKSFPQTIFKSLVMTDATVQCTGLSELLKLRHPSPRACD